MLESFGMSAHDLLLGVFYLHAEVLQASLLLQQPVLCTVSLLDDFKTAVCLFWLLWQANFPFFV